MSEKAPAPLNPVAMRDVNEALEKGNIHTLGLNTKAKKDINEAYESAFKTKPPEGIDKDPRFEDIKQDLIKGWEKNNGPRFDNVGILKTEFQNFYFGNPEDYKKGGKPKSIDDRAIDEFRKRHPQEARIYDQKERIRIYDNPNGDPAVKEVEDEILRKTNKDPMLTSDNSLYRGDSYGQRWARVNQNVSLHTWNAFIDKYPEKARVYADKINSLQTALKVREEALKRKQETNEIPDTLENNYAYRDFIFNPQTGLNVRVWEGVDPRQSLTTTQYEKRFAEIKAQMEQEFAQSYPDIWAKYHSQANSDQSTNPVPINQNQGVVAGLSLPSEIVGGLAIINDADPDNSTMDQAAIDGIGLRGREQDHSENQPDHPETFNPASLLGIDTMDIDQFFSLNRDDIYNFMRRLVTNRDPRIVKKAENLLRLTEEGKDRYLKDNPGKNTVDF